ncbi:MAG: SH3 domain protein [Polaribacter sp.]|jgi:SH3 domain protein
MKQTKISIFTAILFSILVISTNIQAEIAYVFDKGKIWTRSGPSKDFKVKHKILPGTQLDVLSENTETGYTQVKDIKGREFWIKSGYLTSTPTASLLLESALNRLDKVTLKSTQDIQILKREIREMQSLKEINQKLQSKIFNLNIKLEQVEQSNSAFSKRFNREIFFAGGLTILVGMIFGWLFGGRSKKRNDGWG